MVDHESLDAFINTLRVEMLKHESAELKIALHWVELFHSARFGDLLDEAFQENWPEIYGQLTGGLHWPGDLMPLSISSPSDSHVTRNLSQGTWNVEEAGVYSFPIESLLHVELIKHSALFVNKRSGEREQFYQTAERFVSGQIMANESSAILVFHRRVHGHSVCPLNLKLVRLTSRAKHE